MTIKSVRISRSRKKYLDKEMFDNFKNLFSGFSTMSDQLDAYKLKILNYLDNE